jgi:hypothetical protein
MLPWVTCERCCQVSEVSGASALTPSLLILSQLAKLRPVRAVRWVNALNPSSLTRVQSARLRMVSPNNHNFKINLLHITNYARQTKI